MGCGGCLILVRTCLFAVTLNVWHPTFVQRCPLLLMRREKWKQQRPQSGYRTCAAMELTNDTMRMCGQGMLNSFQSQAFRVFYGMQFAEPCPRIKIGLWEGWLSPLSHVPSPAFHVFLWNAICHSFPLIKIRPWEGWLMSPL